MGQQRDAVNADPTFKQWVATLSGRPPPFQCRSDDAGGRKIFCLGSPRSITPFIEEGGGGRGAAECCNIKRKFHTDIPTH